MDCNKIEIELRRLLAQVENWRQQQKVTTIDKDLAMTRLQSLYAEVTDITTIDPPLVIDESKIEEGGDVVESALTEPSARWNTTTFEIEDENIDQQSEQELLSQDTFADDTTDESQDQMPIDSPQAKCDQDSAEDDQSEPTDREQADDHAPAESESTEIDTENADEHQNSDAEQQEAAPETQEVVKDESPRVFGIKVNAYARQEIIDTLFRGNVDLFDAECNRIDAMEDLEDALIYIGENYRWIPDNMTTIRFIDLMETHFTNRSQH